MVIHLNISEEFLFVVGGFDQNEAEGAEVTTLNPSDNPLPDCVQDLSSAPIKFTGSKGAALIDADRTVIGSTHNPMQYLIEFFYTDCLFRGHETF